MQRGALGAPDIPEGAGGLEREHSWGLVPRPRVPCFQPGRQSRPRREVADPSQQQKQARTPSISRGRRLLWARAGLAAMVQWPQAGVSGPGIQSFVSTVCKQSCRFFLPGCKVEASGRAGEGAGAGRHCPGAPGTPRVGGAEQEGFPVLETLSRASGTERVPAASRCRPRIPQRPLTARGAAPSGGRWSRGGDRLCSSLLHPVRQAAPCTGAPQSPLQEIQKSPCPLNRAGARLPHRGQKARDRKCQKKSGQRRAGHSVLLPGCRFSNIPGAGGPQPREKKKLSKSILTAGPGGRAPRRAG